jgi:PBP1b-binding outer membrane lipoprotein LpoB
MKKIFLILFVAGLLTACSNNSKTENKKEASSDSNSKMQDSSKIKNEPAHSMTPRRPRD